MKQNNISTKIKWLRISYWIGAIADIMVGVAAFLPGLRQLVWGLDMPIQGAGLIFVGYFGAVAFAWAFLLLWADRKPLERRGIALITIFPVVTGLMAAEICAIVQNIAPMLNLGLMLGGQTMLIILYAFSYINSREESE